MSIPKKMGDIITRWGKCFGKVLFVEPPRDFWFVMGEYLQSPYGIIQLATYLEMEVKGFEIEVFDCTAKQVDWKGMERRVQSFNPDVVASSVFATFNTYLVARTLDARARLFQILIRFCRILEDKSTRAKKREGILVSTAVAV